MRLVNKSYKNTYDIVIGGPGGIAGLTALREITSRGLRNLNNLKIFAPEARNRVGGRIEWDDNFLDKGGAGIHLPDELDTKKLNDDVTKDMWGAFDIVRFAKTIEVEFHRGDRRFVLIKDGQKVKQADVNVAIDKIYDTLYRAAKDIRTGKIKTDISVADALKDLMTNKICKPLINSVFSIADAGLNAKDISVIDDWNALESTTPLFPDIGMGRLIERYSRAVEDRISFEKEITNINIDKKLKHVEITYKDLATGALDTIFAKKFIPTFSIGVWQHLIKEGKVQGLPPEKVKAINSMQMGHLNKVIMRMDEKFFEQNGIKDFTKMVISSGRMNTDAEFLFRPMGEPIIVRFIGGEKGKEFEKYKSWAVAHTKQLLANVYGKDSVEKNFESARVTAWDHDIYARGSYAAATVNNFDARIEYTKPVDDLVFMAGEACFYPDIGLHTHISGASYSGYLAANEALKSLSLKRRK